MNPTLSQRWFDDFLSKIIKQVRSASDLLGDFDRLMYHQEEPFQSLSIYAQFKVYELAKQAGVKVILDGQGADEILAGYH